MFSISIWAELARRLDLSGRELQIVRGIFDDQTESSIATMLCISRSTVHTHVERLHHKLSVPDRAQLILRIVQEYIALMLGSGSRVSSLISTMRASVD